MKFKHFLKKEYYSVFFFDYIYIFSSLAFIVCGGISSLVFRANMFSSMLLICGVLAFLFFVLTPIFTYRTKIEHFLYDTKLKKLIETNTDFDKKALFRIIFITDLHLHDFLPKRYVKGYIDKINKLQPDLLIFGGDFIIDDKTKFNNLDVLKGFGNYKKIAVLGNHDYNIRSRFKEEGKLTKAHFAVSNKIKKYLKSFGIETVINENKIFNVKNDKELNIFGLGCFWADKHDFSRFEPKNINFVISHHPEAFDDLKNQNIDLVLAGHNHGGGQIKLNNKISAHRILRLISKKWRYDFNHLVSGLYTNKHGIKIYLSRGLGVTGISMRLNCPPEITVIDIV